MLNCYTLFTLLLLEDCTLMTDLMTCAGVWCWRWQDVGH